MKRKSIFLIGTAWKRLLAVVATMSIVATMMPIGAVSADTGSTVSTGYQVQINETTGSNGFTHPGVGLTKAILENARAEIQSGKDPWYSYYQAMAADPMASKTVTSSNQSASDPAKPAIVAFNCQCFEPRFIQDGLKVYTQALMYYFTGDETYRANAMHIIRIWEQMDPAQYAYYTDAHIHSAIPLNRMLTGAEILRYSSYQDPADAWTDQDTALLTNNLIVPVTETFLHNNNYFMNQHNYPLLGAMAGYIFTDNRDRYNEAVEWWTVNSTAVNQGFNGSIKQLFRWVDTDAVTGEKISNPHVQHVEMGRDQAHGGGDLTNAAIISRMLLAQGTKVDPVAGTVSTAANAVGPMEFLDDRILAAANYFWQYMLGYDTPWTPVPYSYNPDGSIRAIYYQFSSGYWGRFNTTNFWDFYSYYTYVKGIDLKEKAPYYYEAFTKKLFLNWENPDGGDDYWLYIPKAAEADAAKFLPPQQTNPSLTEMEVRYTSFDNNTSTVQEGDTAFVRFNATETGAKIALLTAAMGNTTFAFKVRTNGVATLQMSHGINDTITLPDTKGQWRYVSYTMNQLQYFSDMLYITVKGTPGTTVDIDHINKDAGTQLTPPAFNGGKTNINLFAYVGAPVSIDLSAADSNSADVVAYDSTNLPQGAQFDTNTGAFSWQPTQAGTYAFTVSASDGTSMTAGNVKITVANDRASAVQAAIAPYYPNASYVTSSLTNYKVAYNDTMAQIQTASDAQFIQQLQTLRSATEGLKLLTPLLPDGSIDYPGIVTSDFGDGIINLTDNTSDTAAGLAFMPNAYRTIDFGADFRVSATAISIQGRAGFSDRGAGMTIFASNDKINWTRITSGETPMTDGMSTLTVDDAYKNAQFRFIRIQLIDPQPDVIFNKPLGILELGELRIFGERHETAAPIAGTIAEALAEAANLPAANYTKQSYYLFQKELDYVKNAVGNPDYTEQELINEVYDARNLLVQSTTSLFSFEGNAKNTLGYPDGAVFGTQAYAPGKVGQALSLNGTDSYAMLSGIHPLSTYNEITVAAWVYWNGDSQWQRIFDFGNNTSQYMFLTPSSGNNLMRFGIKNNGTEQYVETAQLPANQWVHVAVTLGNGTVKLYVNGALKASSSSITIKPSDFQPTVNYIGKSQWPDPLFHGMIDEFRIYNRVLSDAEIGAVYNLAGYGADSSLLTYLLDQAAAVGNAGIYTADSLQALQQAIPAAQAVASNTNASQAQVDAAADSLRAAYEGLVYLPGIPAIAPVMDKYVIADGNQISFKLHQLNSVTGTTYSVSGLPQGAIFDSDQRTVVWTPDKTQTGIYPVTLTAAANGESTSRTVKLTVEGQPIIASNETVELPASQAATYKVKASDPTGATLTYSAVKLPSGAAFDTATGTFTWTPTISNYGDNVVTFTVSNGLYKVSQTVDFKVKLDIVQPFGYTKASYYLYQKKVEPILAALALPGADITAIAAQLAQAESVLVRVPLSQYSFEGNANDSFGTTAGTVSGTAAYAAGKVGQAISLNGTDSYVKLPASHPLSSDDAITLSAWVYWNGSSQWQRIFDFGNNTSQYMFLTPRSGSNTLRFAIKNGGSEQIVETSQLAANQWAHVAVTLGGGTAKLYVNGALAATNSGFTIKPSDFKPSLNYIGKSQWPDPLFNGMIDEFKIYNYVLSDSEIQNDYNGVKWTDKSLLTLLLSKAAALDSAHYSPTSWQAVSDAVASAQALPANATQDTIDAASTQLLNAIGALGQLYLKPISPVGYTKGSYYLYTQEVARIQAALSKPGADEEALFTQYTQAANLLVRAVPVPLSLYSFEGNTKNSYGTDVGTANGTESYAAGNIGQAISLNGTNNYVTLSATNPMASYDQITVASWVYWNGSSQWQRIFDFGNNTSQYMFLTPRSGTNTLRFAIKNGGGEQSVETSQLAANQWAHVAVTLSGGTAKLYVNGTLAATKSGFTIKPSDFKPSLNYIGKSQFSDPLFNGKIDEFSIFNYALSDTDIQSIYNAKQWTDTSLVQLLLNKAAALDASLYSPSGWQALTDAVANAKALPADATQAMIDAASAQLLNALGGLNNIPVFTPISDKTVEAGTSVSFAVYATDPDGDALTFSAGSLPDGATFDPQSSQFAWSPKVPGNYSVTFNVYDATGATASTTVGIKVVDTTPPTTADDAPIHWVNHDAAVNLTATDSGSGVAATYYTIDGGVQQTGTTVNIVGEGAHSLVYWSVDNAGNVEQPHTVAVNIDMTAPVTAASVNPEAPDGSNGWYAHAVTVSFSASDNLSGTAKTEYSLDGGSTWQSYTNPVAFNQDGKYTVSYRSTDNAGNVEAAKTISFNLDSTAPATVATPSQPDGANGWYAHQATVSLSATDNLSGVAMTEYSLDSGATWQTYTSALMFDKEGKYTISYRSTDNAGNGEALKTININLDSTAPVTTAVVTPAQPDGQHGWNVHPVTVTLSAYDNLSGVAKSEYSLDGGSTWLAYTAPVTLNQDSKYTLSYRSTDNAGNVEDAKTISFDLDQTAPTITVSGLVYGTYSDSMDITPILTLGDNLSGVDSSKTTVTVSTYGLQQTVQQGASIPLYTLPLGSHTFIVTASDMAGNTSSQTVLFQTTTSIQSMQALVTRFTNMGLIDNAGIANSLQSKLAANNLADFISAVQAQSGKHISEDTAKYLLRDAQYLLSNH